VKSLNINQKKILVTGLVLTSISFLIWIIAGAEIFTKTEVLVDVKDELFGTTYKEWQSTFIWGLDLTLIITGAVGFSGAVLMYILRSGKNKSE